MSHHQIRQITLTKEELKELHKRIRQAKDRKTADRLRVIWLKAEGYKHHVIAHLLQISINVVSQCLQRYLAGGLEALCETKYQGKQARLTAEQQEILKLKTRIYNTAAQVIAWVEKQFEVSYKLRGMHTLLKQLGFTYKKNRLVPSKADPEAQRQFVNWFEKVRAELGPEDRIYFGDAVHVKHNAEAGYAWSESGNPHLIPTNTGRQRYNILGAYCTQTHEHLFILTEDNINQDTIIELLKQLRAKHPGDGKIYWILDNASYNRALRVREQAVESSIVITYQLPYSPNLNLCGLVFIKPKCAQYIQVRYSLWEQPAATLSEIHSWGGAVWPSTTLFNIGEFTLRLKDGREGTGVVTRISGGVIVFFGHGPYPE